MMETARLCQFAAFVALNQVLNVGSVRIMISALDVRTQNAKFKLA